MKKNENHLFRFETVKTTHTGVNYVASLFILFTNKVYYASNAVLNIDTYCICYYLNN